MKLFRKFRYKMVVKKRIRKYILYAIGEILLVMIGILLALQVNNKNEERKSKLEEQNMLHEIIKDLKLEQRQFEILIDNHKKDEKYFEKIETKGYSTKELDSLFLKLNVYSGYEARNAGYIGLKSSNNIKLIRNERLRTKIIYYYESALNTLNSNAKWQENFVLSYIEKYIIEANVPINADFIITNRTFIEEELNKAQLNTLINYRKISSKYLISILNSTLIFNEDLIEIINEELESY